MLYSSPQLQQPGSYQKSAEILIAGRLRGKAICPITVPDPLIG